MIAADALKPFVPGTESVALSIASWRGFDAAGLLRSLDRYPYGCIEQTTSRALPLLYFNDVALLSGKPLDKDIETRVQEAIWRVLDMQTAAGSFGMWGPYGGIVDWLSVYATDFLLQAKAKGKNVPEAQLRQAVTYLRSLAANDSGNAGAYALYVLAREGEANIGRLRQFHDAEVGKLGDSIRERQGMAYYVYSSLDATLGQGPFAIRAGVAGPNVEKTIASIDAELTQVIEQGFTDQEIEESKSYMIGSLPRQLETNAGIASFLLQCDLFDLGMDYDVRLPGLISAVTQDAAHAAARRLLDSARATIAVAGPWSPSSDVAGEPRS